MARATKNNNDNNLKEKKISNNTSSITKSKTKKSTTSLTKSKNSNNTHSKKSNSKKTFPIVSEHYDLPNTYDKTFIALLFQSPTTLFAFWEISELDKTNLIDKYGSHFFQNTRPILHIYNKTTDSSFEIEINDYATNWYIDVDNTDCEFEIQLGRKSYNSNTDDFIVLASSNSLTSPNDHILLEKLPKTFEFLNLKTNKITTRSINNTSFSKIYNIYDFYKEIYKDELSNNPSSK